MARDRDVAAFDRRAAAYEQGFVGRWHVALSGRVAELLVDAHPSPASVLDVGTGTGALLRDLTPRAPGLRRCVGVDAAPRMAATAAASVAALPVGVVAGRAEQLPFADGAFEVVVSSLSFDHWADQRRGLAECARVLSPSGRLFLVDLFSPWLWPTTQVGRRGRARTPGRATAILREVGFSQLSWTPVARFIRAVVASR